MPRSVFLFSFLFVFYCFKSQNNLPWDKDYKLQLSDFQSKQTLIGNTKFSSVNATGTFEFEYHMHVFQFMFTKNFNNKVHCYFRQSSASIEAPDTSSALELLSFARYEFDLCELYARKLRQKLYLSKKLFSKQDFYKPIYEEVQTEFSKRYDQAAALTQVGRERAKLGQMHAEVLIQLEELRDFCETCKPSR